MRAALVFLVACTPRVEVFCDPDGHPASPAPVPDAVEDPEVPVVAEGEPAPLRPVVCETVGTGVGDGFFAIEPFLGDVYAGTFGYGLEGTSMLYRAPGWEQVSPGITGVSESVCDLLEHDGWLYANTESSGDILRSADGTDWTRVQDGADGTIGCALAVHDGWLYAVDYDNQDRRNGRIRRSSDGTSWETVYDSGTESLYLRELVSHDGVLHAFATIEGVGQGVWLRSVDGVSWSRTETPSRFFRAYSDASGLWIGSTERTSNGPTGIWHSPDGESVGLVQPIPTAYVTEIETWDGQRFAGTSAGWKDDVGPSGLWAEQPDGSWTEVCSFPETAAWAVRAGPDALYVGTWDYGGQGFVYRVRREMVPVD